MRVLLIEDDRRLAASLQRGLGESGFEVDSFHEPTDAIAAALSTAYGVIVVDAMLSGPDGFEVCRQLRRQRVSSPILMLTSRNAVQDQVSVLEAGADDYMRKPFALRELIARLRALARRHLPDPESLLRSGDIVLDTGAHTVTVNGIPVNLSAKEFAILEFFLHHPGRLLSRSQIIEYVWDYDFNGGDNLVEVYMGRLRRKLMSAGSPDPFATVRGAGYRLESTR